MPKEPPRSAAVILRRFTELNERDQLLAYEAIRDYLRASGTAALSDTVLDDRAEALRVMAAAAAHHGLKDLSQLEVKQFDATPDEIREGWKSGRVIRVFSTWRFARQALAGTKTRPTARQRALKSAAGAMRLRTDDYLAGVRDWLVTNPPKLTARGYNEWSREHNATRAPSELPYPGYHPIRSALGISWKEVIRVARGEATLAGAQKKSKNKPISRRSQSSGDHDLVTSIDIVAMSGHGHSTVQSWMHRPNFPVPVLVMGNRRYWMREDIKAFLAGKPFPKRKRNELHGLYVNRVGAAKILGVKPDVVERIKGRPEPTFRGANRLWLRSEIETFHAERLRVGVRKGRPRKKSQ